MQTSVTLIELFMKCCSNSLALLLSSPASLDSKGWQSFNSGRQNWLKTSIPSEFLLVPLLASVSQVQLARLYGNCALRSTCQNQTANKETETKHKSPNPQQTKKNIQGVLGGSERRKSNYNRCRPSQYKIEYYTLCLALNLTFTSLVY